MKLRRARDETVIEKVNILPMTINFTGKTDFNDYFTAKEIEKPDDYGRNCLENNILGRALKGKKLENEKITFQIYEKEIEEDINIVYKGKVDGVKYWNHDDHPGPNDQMAKVMEMLEIHQSLNE